MKRTTLDSLITEKSLALVNGSGSEFLLEHGFLDFIVNRKELKHKLATVLTLLKN